MCVCVVNPFVLDVRLVDVSAGVTQEEGRTEFLHLASAALALIFLARRIQLVLSLVDPEVEFCVLTNTVYRSPLVGIFFFFFVRKSPSSCDCIGIRTHIPTSEGFEVTN